MSVILIMVDVITTVSIQWEAISVSVEKDFNLQAMKETALVTFKVYIVLRI